MKRVFGIDLGTNSIGWSIVEQLENGKYDIIFAVVYIK